MSTAPTIPSSSYEVAKARLQTLTAQIEAALETKLQERKAALEGALKEARRRVAAIDKAKASLDDVDRRIAEYEQSKAFDRFSDTTVKLAAHRSELIEKLLSGLSVSLDDGQESVDISEEAKQGLRDLKGELESAMAEVAKREQILDGIAARASEIDRQIEAEAIQENEGESSGRLPVLSAERTAIPARITAAERSLDRAIAKLSPIMERISIAAAAAAGPMVVQAKAIIARRLEKYFNPIMSAALVEKCDAVTKLDWMAYMQPRSVGMGEIQMAEAGLKKVEAMLSGPFPLNWR